MLTSSLIYGFIFGVFTPLLTARFAKIVPCTPDEMLVYLPRGRWLRFLGSSRTRRLYGRRLLWCLFWGALNACFCALFFMAHGLREFSFCIPALFLVLSVAAAVDQRTMYLPDVITVPLLLAGFAVACTPSLSPLFGLTPEASAAGAVFGYVLPTLTAAVMHRFRPDGMGGGDVKMLAALGAWMGIELLALAVFGSVFVFGGVYLATGRRAGPYGPSLAFAAALTLVFQRFLTGLLF